jgi:hypothetical protein
MSFVIDGADWDFTGLPAHAVVGRLERRLAFIAVSAGRDEEVYVGDDFQRRPMRGTETLWQMVGGGGLPGEVRQELAAWLGHAPYYTDMPDWPDGADDTVVTVDGGFPEDNADVAWVHHARRSGSAMASVSERYAGRLPTHTAHGATDVHFVANEAGRIAFWRDAIRFSGDNATSLVRFAPSAYPNLYFVPGVVARVDRFAGGYLALRQDVQAAFSALDEHGVWLFTEAPPAVTPQEPRIGTEPSPTNAVVEERFRNLGLDAAPENPNVRLDRASREARETTVSGRVLYCQWHVKLQPHRNRIHVHGPVPQSGGRVVVGMIDDHLPLP